MNKDPPAINGYEWRRNIQGGLRGFVRSWQQTQTDIAETETSLRQDLTRFNPEAPGARKATAPFEKKYPHLEVIELSCYISVKKADVPRYWLDQTAVFLDLYFNKWAAALERGDREGHLHVQFTGQVHSANTPEAIELIKNLFKSHLQGPLDNVSCGFKPFDKTQTFPFMLSYVTKDRHLAHYGFRYSSNFTQAELHRGQTEYAIRRGYSDKDRTKLTKKNFFTILRSWATDNFFLSNSRLSAGFFS